MTRNESALSMSVSTRSHAEWSAWARDKEAECERLRVALTEIADGYERHNPGWWIKKAKAALGHRASP